MSVLKVKFIIISDACGNGKTYVDGSCRASCTGVDTCCQTYNKCTVNEGDCDSDKDCLNGLKCGTNNCKDFFGHGGFDRFDDCCYNP